MYSQLKIPCTLSVGCYPKREMPCREFWMGHGSTGTFVLESKLVQTQLQAASFLNHCLILLGYQTSLEAPWGHAFPIPYLQNDKSKWRALHLFLFKFNQWFWLIVPSCWNLFYLLVCQLIYQLSSPGSKHPFYRCCLAAPCTPPPMPLRLYLNTFLLLPARLPPTWGQGACLYAAESWHRAQGLVWWRSSVCFEWMNE